MGRRTLLGRGQGLQRCPRRHHETGLHTRAARASGSAPRRACGRCRAEIVHACTLLRNRKCCRDAECAEASCRWEATRDRTQGTGAPAKPGGHVQGRANEHAVRTGAREGTRRAPPGGYRDVELHVQGEPSQSIARPARLARQAHGLTSGIRRMLLRMDGRHGGGSSCYVPRLYHRCRYIPRLYHRCCHSQCCGRGHHGGGRSFATGNRGWSR
jgi:hypothetical protein